MKKWIIMGLVLIPMVGVAHGGVSKNIGSAVVYLNQNPLSPFVGESTDLAITITDDKFTPLANLPVTLTLTDTFLGDASKDQQVLTKQFTTDVNGTFEFDYQFPKADYYDVELNFTDPTSGQNDLTGFLVQPREPGNHSSKSIILPAAVGLVAGIIIGTMLKRKAK